MRRLVLGQYFFFSKNSAKKIYVLKEAPEFLKMWVKQSFVNSEK